MTKKRSVFLALLLLYPSITLAGEPLYLEPVTLGKTLAEEAEDAKQRYDLALKFADSKPSREARAKCPEAFDEAGLRDDDSIVRFFTAANSSLRTAMTTYAVGLAKKGCSTKTKSSSEVKIMVSQLPKGVLPQLEAPKFSSGGTSGAPVPAAASMTSMIMQGMTQFLMERAREEAAAFAMDQIGKGLCENALCKDKLFKSVCILVKAIEESKLSFNPGRMFFQAVRQDLLELPEHIADVLADDFSFEGKDLIGCILKVGYGIFRGIERRVPPETIVIDAVTKFDELKSCRQVLGFPDPSDAGQVWTPEAEAVRSTLRILMVVLLAKSQAEIEAYRLDLSKLVKEVTVGLASTSLEKKFKKDLDVLAPVCVRLVETARAFREAKSEELLARLENVLTSSLEVLAVSLEYSLPPGLPGDKLNKLQNILVNIRSGLEKLLTGDFAGGLIEFLAIVEFPHDQEPFKSLFRFSALLADIAGAKSSEEISAALERAAAPAGSWRLRRKKVAWGIGAMVGVGFGGEKLTKQGANDDLPLGLVFGLHLPVGLQISTPLGGSWALGGMLQVINIGALGQAWITGDAGKQEVSVEPEIGFLQVFAPGVQIFFGIGDTPFTVSLGCEYVFKQRSSSLNGDDISYNALRFGLNVGVDVPIFIW